MAGGLALARKFLAAPEQYLRSGKKFTPARDFQDLRDMAAAEGVEMKLSHPRPMSIFDRTTPSAAVTAKVHGMDFPGKAKFYEPSKLRRKDPDELVNYEILPSTGFEHIPGGRVVHGRMNEELLKSDDLLQVINMMGSVTGKKTGSQVYPWLYQTMLLPEFANSRNVVHTFTPENILRNSALRAAAVVKGIPSKQMTMPGLYSYDPSEWLGKTDDAAYVGHMLEAFKGNYDAEIDRLLARRDDLLSSGFSSPSAEEATARRLDAALNRIDTSNRDSLVYGPGEPERVVEYLRDPGGVKGLGQIGPDTIRLLRSVRKGDPVPGTRLPMRKGGLALAAYCSGGRSR